MCTHKDLRLDVYFLLLSISRYLHTGDFFFFFRKFCLVGLTIDANFDNHDSITIVETTITILSLSWHTVMILSQYSQDFSTMILKFTHHFLLVYVISILHISNMRPVAGFSTFIRNNLERRRHFLHRK